MADIPEEQLRFSQLAVTRGWIRPEQARAVFELYKRYAEKGGEKPSIPRILVNKGYLGRKQAETLLRHIYNGEPLPESVLPLAPSAPALSAVQQMPDVPPRPSGGFLTPHFVPQSPTPPAGQRRPVMNTPASGIPVPPTRTANVPPGGIQQRQAATPPAAAQPVAPNPKVPQTVPPAPRTPHDTRAIPAASPPRIPPPPDKSPPRPLSQNAPAQKPSQPLQAPRPAAPRPPTPPPLGDSESAILEGLGALVLSRELQEIRTYRIESVVGEGAMGTVYKAIQLSMDRVVALKVLPPDRTRDAKFVEEFLEEARNAGRLNHPNLIRVHEVGKSGSLFFYSMEYVDGLRLDEMIDECDNGRLDTRQSVHIFSQVASALDYGNRAGIIHRELRPNSVMVTSDGLAKLADLGLVKDEETRFLVGENAYYVSPEQALGQAPDTRSDIYSLGCCLFQAITGERPFDAGGTPQEVLMQRLQVPAPSPYQFNSSLPQELSRAVMKMMQRDPAQRFQTPGEVVDALKKITFAPLATPQRTRTTSNRRKFRR